ncbi:hypothetical protein DACRYDRAFT_107081 [Dacryopinax primogenitus]|uniref:Uncharacterized protein n=1 Tax=Dacryopinax primogenitus (strain DJM 731) TaxID=1858805 RepID=M5G062_DACPD|nr:uncharacterized protein DACRYDRAFT_107081 [Dacryopinax primogenitus]EJU02144.1 hypothetical protein DACRYDRAFT_107081 [Dacryopinax primogenitus]
MFTIRITPFVSLLALSWLATTTRVLQTENQWLATVEARSFDQLDVGYGVRHLDNRDIDLHDQDELHERETDEDSSWLELRTPPDPAEPEKAAEQLVKEHEKTAE